jgi:hypothetical protein
MRHAPKTRIQIQISNDKVSAVMPSRAVLANLPKKVQSSLKCVGQVFIQVPAAFTVAL